MRGEERRNAPIGVRCAAVGLAMLCFLVALAAPGSIFDLPELHWLPPGEWPGWLLQLHWIVGLLVVAPFAIAAIVARDLRASRQRSWELVLKALKPSLAGIPAEHLEEDRVLWDKREDAARTLWAYEKDRIMSLRGRLGLQALLFGDIERERDDGLRSPIEVTVPGVTTQPPGVPLAGPGLIPPRPSNGSSGLNGGPSANGSPGPNGK